MKILVLSDVHANRQALESVLAKEKYFDLLVCAGDYVDYGVDPSFVVNYFSSYQGDKYLVRGNHDDHLISVFKDGCYKILSNQSYKWIHYNCSLLNSEEVHFLETLPVVSSFECDGINYLIKHQYDDEYGEIKTEAEFNLFWNFYAPNIMNDVSNRCIIFGHSHRQYIHKIGEGMECINPGSVSYRRPDDNGKDAQYIVIEDGNIRLCSVPYDRSISLSIVKDFNKRNAMKITELQDAYFFFGDAPSTRSELVKEK